LRRRHPVDSGHARPMPRSQCYRIAASRSSSDRSARLSFDRGR
jgi:hypothetical protein